MTKLHQLTLAEAAEAVRTRQVSSVELTRESLERIQRLDPALNAFITVTDDLAMAQARAADEEIASGNYRGALHGIPTALKDLVDVKDVLTTAASHVLQQNVADKDAEVTTRLRRAGAVIVGKTNLHEFAYGGSGLISAYGVARNPWDTDRITGGSSSGSAAAVAAGLCYMAIGTDTAGSIRLPSALCGLVGLKPTHGMVSAEGVVELSRSLDHVGPITRTVEDARLAMTVIATMEVPERKASTVKIGVAREYFLAEAQSDVVRMWEAALAMIAADPEVELCEVALPIDNDRTLQKAESYQYHRQFSASAKLYDAATRERIESGAESTPEETERLRTELASYRAAANRRVFEGDLHIVATLTTPMEAPRIADLDGKPELRATELLMLRNTRPFNVLGWPTITIPCGLTDSGLPVGLQLSAGFRQEGFLLDVAARCERILAFSGSPRLFA